MNTVKFIDSECELCKIKFTQTKFTICHECFYKEHECFYKEIDNTFKKLLIYHKLKYVGYYILIIVPLMLFIGLKFGWITQWLCILCMALGQNLHEIVYWLMRKF